MKSQIKLLCGQLQSANVKEDLYFRLRHLQKLDAGVHHPRESKLFLNIYNESGKRWCVLRKVMWCGMKISKEGKSFFLRTFKYLQIDGNNNEISGAGVNPAHAVVLNIPNQITQILLRNGLTLIWSWPVRCGGRGNGEKFEAGHKDRVFKYRFSLS